MIFFKWYGKNVQTSVDIPEFHGVQIHPHDRGFHLQQEAIDREALRPSPDYLRVLYNINQIDSDQVYIKVGNHTVFVGRP